MQDTFSLTELNLIELSSSDLTEISGGHNGLAYKIGYAIGEGVRKVGEVLGVVAIFIAKTAEESE